MSEPKFKIVVAWVKSEEYPEIHPYLIDEIVSEDLDYHKVLELYEEMTDSLDDMEI